MDTKYSSGAGDAVNFAYEAQTPVARRSDQPDLTEKVPKFGMLLPPGLCVNGSKQLGLFGPDKPNTHAAIVFGLGPLDTSTQDVADLDRPVVPGAKQVECSDSGVRTHFVNRRRSTLEEESLDRLERSQAESFEYSQPKALGDRRIHTVEDGICSCDFDPI
jgi:hypothetical protein